MAFYMRRVGSRFIQLQWSEGRRPCCPDENWRPSNLLKLGAQASLAQWQISGLLIRRVVKQVGSTNNEQFKLAGGVSKMSGSPGAIRDSTASIPLVLEFHCFGSDGKSSVPKGCSVWVVGVATVRLNSRLERVLQN